MHEKYSPRKRPSSVDEISGESAPLLGFDTPHAIDADRLAEILDLSLPFVGKPQLGMTLQLVTDAPADIDLPGLRQAFQPCSNIDAVAVDIAIIGNNIAGIYANAKPQAAIGSDPGAALGRFMLDIERTIYRVDCAVELDQQPVSSNADQTAAMLGILGSIDFFM